MVASNHADRAGKGAALLVGGGPGRDYPSVRSLREHGVRTIFARTDSASPVPASRFCDEAHLLPSPREDVDAFRRGLLDLSARSDVVTVVPTREECVYLLSKYRDSFREHATFVVPPFEVLRSAQDRLRLIEEARNAGVPVPDTRLLTEGRDWSRRSVVKSRYNLLANAYDEAIPPGRVDVVKSIRHLEPGTRPDVEAICEEMGHVPIVQEFVPTDDEFVFAALYDRGDPLATFQHRQVRGESYLGGGGVYRKSVYFEELEAVGERLLDHLDWHGLACIEYMRDADTGEFVLTEVNPRTWKSMSVAVRAGADFPYYYWLAANGSREAIDAEYDRGVGTHSVYGEAHYVAELLRARSPHVERPSIPATSLALLSSLVRDPHFDCTRIDDPGPFVHGLLKQVRNVLGGVGRGHRFRGSR